MTGSNDPMEGMIRGALTAARIRFIEGDRNAAKLDFYLPDLKVYIEVKQFHSDRIADQMSRAENVIVAQGRGAVEVLASLIRSGRLEPPRPMVRTPDFDSGNRGSNPREAAKCR